MGFTLPRRFEGRQVRISHSSPRIKDVCGRCTLVRDSGNRLEFQIDHESLYGFAPQIYETNMIEGEMNNLANGRRKIEIIE